MQRSLIIAVVIAALVLIFSLQNTETVMVDFWFWTREPPVAALVLFSFAMGVLVSTLFGVGSLYKKNQEIKFLKREKEEGAKVEEKPAEEKLPPAQETEGEPRQD